MSHPIVREHTFTMFVQYDQYGYIRFLVKDESGDIIEPDSPWCAYMGDATECLAMTLLESLPDARTGKPGLTEPDRVKVEQY